MMMDSKGAPGGTVRLYHGSDVPIKHPDTAHNTGFADLGPGFYLTDDHDAAWRRARSRARREGAAAGVVSAFAFDETALRWATWGEGNPQIDGHAAGEPFGLRFEESGSGIVAWARYIDACRRGRTAVTGLGEPAVVRGWADYRRNASDRPSSTLAMKSRFVNARYVPNVYSKVRTLFLSGRPQFGGCTRNERVRR